jgi:hypothetical protein
MLPKTKLYKIGDSMSGMQYLVMFMVPVMVCNKFGISRWGFILGVFVVLVMYGLNKQSNEGAINHYIWYCFQPTYVEGNTSPNDNKENKTEGKEKWAY